MNHAKLIAQAKEAGLPLGHIPDVPTVVWEKLVARGEAIDALIVALEAAQERAEGWVQHDTEAYRAALKRQDERISALVRVAEAARAHLAVWDGCVDEATVVPPNLVASVEQLRLDATALDREEQRP